MSNNRPQIFRRKKNPQNSADLQSNIKNKTFKNTKIEQKAKKAFRAI